MVNFRFENILQRIIVMKKTLALIAIITIFVIGFLQAATTLHGNFACTSNPGLTEAPGIVEKYSYDGVNAKIRCIGMEQICWAIEDDGDLCINTDAPPSIVTNPQYVVKKF
jgi:hypothetical protein